MNNNYCSICKEEIKGDVFILNRSVQCETCTFSNGEVEQAKAPLLTIEVQDLNSVPVVKVDGQVVNGKVSVKYEWNTKTHPEDDNKHNIEIQYIKTIDNRPATVTVSIPPVKKV